MKKIKYFLFSLICMFCCSVVFAKDEITVESMIPVYDENSGVIVTEENGVHSVIFNDKEQSVKYNIVLKNNTDKDIPIENLSLSKPTEDFLKYELTGLNSGDIIKANSTKDVVISLETVKTEGWGRNFDIVLTSEVSLDSSVLNPNTNDFVVILFILSIIFGCSVFVLKNKKVARYGILIIGFFSVVPYINADKVYMVPIKINVSYESQNIMKSAYYIDDYDNIKYNDFWEYKEYITNLYIQNEFEDLTDYAYKFDVSNKGNNKVLAYLVKNGTKRVQYGPDMYYVVDIYDLYIQTDGVLYLNSDASYYFSMPDIISINNIEGIDTSNVTNMSFMFSSTGSRAVENFKLDLNSFDTSNVTNMSFMFSSTGSNSPNFTLDVSNFDTSNVTNMKGMFQGTGYSSSIFTLDVSNFDTSNVTNMSYMFEKAGYWSKEMSLNLTGFNTSKVTDMSYMFASTGNNCTNLILDFSSFDTSKVTNMIGMFNQTGEDSTNFTLDLSSFDTSNVTDMSYMFASTGSNSPNFTLDVSNFDTSKVTNMSDMFHRVGYNDPNFTLDVSNFDTSSVTDMSWMFNDAGYSSLNFALDVSNFDTSSVTDMSAMFQCTGYSSSIFTLNVSNFDTSNVTNMIAMFNRAGYSSPNFTLDVSSFDTSNVTDMKYMFYATGYSNPNFTLDVSNFDTSNVTEMFKMFYQAGYSNPNFTLDVSNFDTSKVVDMSGMFCGTGYNSTKFITSITIKNPKTTSYSTMFRDVATKNGSQITVNYTSETSELVDKMIATKSDGSNVVKGIQVD